MASFLSVVSLLVVVLATGCLSLPVIEEFSSSTVVPTFGWEATTGSVDIDDKNQISMRLVSEEDSTSVPDLHQAHNSWDEQSKLELSTPSIDGDEDDLSFTTAQPDLEITKLHEQQLRHIEDGNTKSQPESESDSESDIRPKYPKFLDRGIKETKEGELEMTTSRLPSFTATSSTVAPHLYAVETSVVGFGKTTGLLTDDTSKVQKVIQPQSSIKLNAKARLPTTTTKSVKTDESESDEESKVPTAELQLDQSASDNVPNLKGQTMRLENNKEESIVAAPKWVSKPIDNQRVKVQQEALAQGKQPVPSKKTE